MKIAIIGASGWLGGSIAREAIERGHDVTAIGRSADKLATVEGAQPVVADVADAASLTSAISGHDVVVASITDRSRPDRSLIPSAARTLLEVLPAAGVERLAFVGGAGSLEVQPGVRAVDTPGFPAEYRDEALAQAEALAILRGSHDVHWTYMSPALVLVPGEKTGSYAVAGGDAPALNDSGESTITAGDFAAAFVDELEQNRYPGKRFTATAR